ncbi:MAG: arylesterase [Bacillota bacterium]
MRRHPMYLVILLVAALLMLGTAGCGRRQKPDNTARQPAPAQAEKASTVKTPDPSIDRTGWPVIVAFGDSLTAGLGVPAEQNYPSQLQAELDERGYRYRVVNAGISGDLSAGGLNRVGSVLEHNPEIVILELGANDGLQGKSTAQLKENLAGIIRRLQQEQVTVVLAGMHAPPNYGPEYTQAFHQVYVDLAKEYSLPFIPFMLANVGGIPELNLADGIHPTPEGYQIVVQTVLQTLEPLLKK